MRQRDTIAAANQLDPALAVPLLFSLLKDTRRSLRWDKPLRQSGACLVGILFWYIAVRLHSPLPQIGLTAMIGPSILLWFSPSTQRYPRWQNGLLAFLYHAEKCPPTQHLAPLLEITSWLVEKPSLTDIPTLQRFVSLLARGLARADRETLATLDTNQLLGILKKQRPEPAVELIIAVLLALATLEVRSDGLWSCVQRLQQHPDERVREAAREISAGFA